MARGVVSTWQCVTLQCLCIHYAAMRGECQLEKRGSHSVGKRSAIYHTLSCDRLHATWKSRLLFMSLRIINCIHTAHSLPRYPVPLEDRHGRAQIFTKSLRFL